MNKHLPWLHSADFIVRFLTTVCLFLYLTANSILSFVPAFLICTGILFIAFAIWRRYVRLNRSLNVALQQVIVHMPLFDLIEILNEREDIKRLIINEEEEM